MRLGPVQRLPKQTKAKTNKAQPQKEALQTEPSPKTTTNIRQNSQKPLVLDLAPYSKRYHFKPEDSVQEIRVQPVATNSHKPARYQSFADAKNIQLQDASSFEELFPFSYVTLDSFFNNKNTNRGAGVHKW